jgi:hypothetical protein
MWLSGNYPRALDGLTKLLSLDMRVLDPAWIGMKLRKLLDYPEPLGDFMAFVPGTQAADLPVDRGLHRQPDHPPLRHARHPRRKRLPAAADGHPEAPEDSTSNGAADARASCAASAATTR